MRIAIDARMMGAEVTRGIGRYVHELVGAMLQIAPEHRYVLVTRSASHAFMSHSSVETVVADIPWYGIEEQLKMAGVLRSTNADVVHVPHWNVPLAYHGPLVTTIHDLLLRHEPMSAKTSTRGIVTRTLKRCGYRMTLGHAVAASRKILVPSQFTADDISALYPEAKSRIVVTGEGMPEVEVESPNSKVESPFLLYVGSAYPHKGLQDLLGAWKTISAQQSNLRLVIAGEMDVFMARVQEDARRLGLPRVEFLGRVSDERLQGLYREALGFVYPTHFEGFGLPPLEAFAAGCPVLSSDAGPLPDVLGPDGAIFFRAGDQNGIIAAVTTLVSDPDSARRNALRAAEKLAERHSWSRTARLTLSAYHDAAHERTSWQEKK